MGVLHGWRFCPRCAGPLTLGDDHVECARCGTVVWANPAPTACALVEDDAGRLLLGRRAHEPYRGLWDTPGGYLGESEHPLAALRRELLEETGLEVEPLEFFGAWMDRYGTGEAAPWTLNLYWRARVVGGELRAADDVAKLAWFERDALPAPAETAFTNVSLVLDAWAGRLARDEQP